VAEQQRAGDGECGGGAALAPAATTPRRKVERTIPRGIRNRPASSAMNNNSLARTYATSGSSRPSWAARKLLKACNSDQSIAPEVNAL
jgi:hypothetical protein